MHTFCKNKTKKSFTWLEKLKRCLNCSQFSVFEVMVLTVANASLKTILTVKVQAKRQKTGWNRVEFSKV